MSEIQSATRSLEAREIAAGLSADEIRAQVEHMVVSEIFAASPQLCSFLRFIVEAAIRDEARRLKAYVIGVEVFRRNLKFDANADPIVRVEATRLRRTIDRYYAGPGLTDPIIIEMPRGSYAPAIRRREATSSPDLHAWVHSTAIDWLWSRPAVLVALAAAVVLVAAGTFYELGQRWGAARPAAAVLVGSRLASAILRPGNGMPNLEIVPFEITGYPNATQIPVGTLFEKLRDAFSRFDTLNVITAPSRVAADMSVAVITASTGGRPVDYIFSGAVDYREDGLTDVRLRLADGIDGTVVWSKIYNNLPASPDQVPAEEKIIFDTASALLQPFGVIRSRDYARQLASPVGDPRYRCVVEASESLRSFNLDQHRSARACLEKLTAAYPSFQIGFTYLGAVYFREARYGSGSPDVAEVLFDKALAMARRGIELKPDSSRAYQIMSTVLFFRRNYEASLAAGEKAASLNKYDMTVIGDYGGRLILSGDIDLGLETLTKAAQFGATLGSWYNGYLSLGHYLKNEIPEAVYYADQVTADGYSMGLVAKILAAYAARDSTRSKRAIEQLVALEPLWQRDPQGSLAKFFVKPEIVARLTRDLKAAGISGSNRFREGLATFDARTGAQSGKSSDN